MALTAIYYDSFGWHTREEYQDSARVYGYDIMTWPGYPAMRAVRGQPGRRGGTLRRAAQAARLPGRACRAYRPGAAAGQGPVRLARGCPCWQRYAELACRFRWVWCPAFAVLNAADPRRGASEQQGHVPQGPAAFEPDSADAAGDLGITAGVCHGESCANAASRPRSMLPGWYPSAQISAARRRAAMWPGTMILP